MSGLDLVQRVTALRPYPFEEQPAGRSRRIAVYDFGVKRDILRQLTQQRLRGDGLPRHHARRRDPQREATTAWCSRTAPAIPSR